MIKLIFGRAPAAASRKPDEDEGVSDNIYHVVVTQRGPAAWEWELHRNGELLSIRVKDGSL